jgi:hypothetical protein
MAHRWLQAFDPLASREADAAGVTLRPLAAPANGTYSGIYKSLTLWMARSEIASSATIDYSTTYGRAVYGSLDDQTLVNQGHVYESGYGGIAIDLPFQGAAIVNQGEAVAAEGCAVYAGYQGIVTNESLISGGDLGVLGGENAFVFNTGTIEGTGTDGFGVYLDSGTIANQAGGEIVGTAEGARATEVLNAGTILATGSAGFAIVATNEVVNDGLVGVTGYDGVGITADSLIVNAGTVGATGAAGIGAASLAGIDNYGVIVATGAYSIGAEAVTLANTGTIAATGTESVAIIAQSVTNTGLATATDGVGVYLQSTGSLTNTGTIEGFGLYGVGVYGGTGTRAAILNAAGATIEGTFGVVLYDGTVIDQGTIEAFAGGYAIELGESADLLRLKPGDAIIGQVVGGSGTLELAKGVEPGTLRAFGYQFIQFATMLVDSDAAWVLKSANALDAALTNEGELTIKGTLSVEVDGSILNDGLIEVDGGRLVDNVGLSSDGTIGILDGGTVSLGTVSVPGTIEFGDATGVLSLGAVTGLPVIDDFRLGDTIDLPDIRFDGAMLTETDEGRILSISSSGTVDLTLLLSGLPGDAVFKLSGDPGGGTELTAVPLGLATLVDTFGGAEAAALEGALAALGVDVASAQSVTDPAFDVFTPAGLAVASGPAPFDTIPVARYVDVENGMPRVAGQTIQIKPGVEAVVLTGTRAATLIGRVADKSSATVVLAGDAGNDTILGAGGSGTILSGSGSNLIRTGPGDVVVVSGGGDTIFTGTGRDTVDSYGSATVHGGAGTALFADLGEAGSHVKAHAGAGTMTMTSGLGLDTFVGGSGSTTMIDAGDGNVAFQFNKGDGGTDTVEGFDAAAGDYIRVTAASFGATQILKHASLVDGNTVVALGDGTRIEFVGVTDLTAADFHG